MDDNIIESFRHFFYEKGYQTHINLKLRTDDDTILFNNSTIVDFKSQMKKNCDIKPTAVIQKCFRNNSNENSFSLFTMVGIIGLLEHECKYYHDFFEYLTEQCGLKPEYLTVVYEPKDVDIAKKCKLINENIQLHLLTNKSDKYSVRWSYGKGYDLTGRGITIVYSNPSVEKCNEYCSIHCNCKKHMQIGNFIKVFSSSNSYIDIGFGMERILSHKVYNDLYNLGNSRIVLDRIATMGFKQRHAKILMNNLRSLNEMIQEGFYPSSKGEGYIVRKLIREIGHIIIENDVKSYPSNNTEILYELLISHTGNGQISEIIQNELNKYYKMIDKNLKTAKKIIRNSGTESDNQSLIEYMRSTLGLPEFLIDDLIQKGSVNEYEDIN